MTGYAVICASVRAPCYSAATASSYQVAVVSPLPGPSTLLGTLGSALAHLDPACRGATVDEAAKALFQRFERAGLWATCRLAPHAASTKGSVILKRSLELEGREDTGGKERRGERKLRDDARRREWMLSQELDVFYALSEGDVLNLDQLFQAVCLLDRIGDTESLVCVTHALLLRGVRPQEAGREPIFIDTVTPQRALQDYALGGYVLRPLQSRPNLLGLPRPEPELFFLPIEVETQRGLDRYSPSQFRGCLVDSAAVLKVSWQGGDATIVVPPPEVASTLRRRRE